MLLLIEKIYHDTDDFKYFGNWVGEKYNIKDDRFKDGMVTQDLVNHDVKEVVIVFNEEVEIIGNEYTE